MAKLPTEATPAAEFLVRHLYRPIDVGAGSRFHAVAETEDPGNDNWFWNDDNAKVLEMMSRPEVWRRFPRETAEILRFVRSMCQGPFIFRRVSSPQLDLIGTEDGVTLYRHALMRLKYDLGRGVVVAGVRFHDERSADNLMLSGSYVEFTYRGRRLKQVLDTGGGRMQAEREGPLLRLRHSAELTTGPAWQKRRLGAVALCHTFDARSMVFQAEATLELAPGSAVSDVVLAIGHGALHYCYFTTVVTDASADGASLYAAGRPSARRHDATGGAYYAIRQGHISGDALAIHSAPCGPLRVAEIETVVETQGKLDRVAARYAFPGTHRGARLVAAEHKLITAGGFYDRIADYAALLRTASAQGAPQAAYDFSISYDYGVTINAFAKCFAVAAAQAAPLDAPPADEFRSLVDAALAHYFDLYVDRHEQRPNAIFSRELAFVILAVITMYRATGSTAYLARLRRLCDVLLDFELRFDDMSGMPASAFLMRKDSPRSAYVDCHSAVLLALTQAVRYIDDPRLPAAIDRGLASYGLETCRFAGSLVDTIQTLMLDEHGVARTENAFWNFKAGLTLRFFAALHAADNLALRAIAAHHRERMALFEQILRRQIERTVTEHPDGVEIRCSVVSTGTNSESQPWAMLGLVGHPFD